VGLIVTDEEGTVVVTAEDDEVVVVVELVVVVISCNLRNFNIAYVTYIIRCIMYYVIGLS